MGSVTDLMLCYTPVYMDWRQTQTRERARGTAAGAVVLAMVVTVLALAGCGQVITLQPTPTPEPTATPLAQLVGTVRAAANVRALPEVANGAVIGRISEGDEIVFLASTADGQWYRIRLGTRYAASSKINSANGEGWVNRSLLSQPGGTVPVDDTPADFSGGTPASSPTPTP